MIPAHRDEPSQPGLRFDDKTEPQMFLPVEPPRLLVVDDDRSMLELLHLHLSAHGYQVELARSAEEAIERMTPRRGDDPRLPPFDLLLTDHRMHGWNGLTMLIEVRTLGWSTPLMLMTAFPDAPLRRAAGRLGVALIEKPFGLEQLSAAVARLLVARANALAF